MTRGGPSDAFRVFHSIARLTATGRHDEFVDGGTGHWTCVDPMPVAWDCFMSAAVTRAHVRWTSGFGARRPSLAEDERLQSVLKRRSTGGRDGPGRAAVWG